MFKASNKRLPLLKSESGFTLLEIMIAIVLLGILMTGVYTIIENGTNTKDRVTYEDREMLQVQTALNRFAIDFSQIYSPLYFSDEERDKAYYSSKGIPTHVVATIPAKRKYEGGDKYPLLSVTGDLIPALVNPDKNTFGFMTSSNRRKVENSRQSRYAWVLYTLRSTEKEREDTKAENELVRTFIPDDIYVRDFEWEKTREQVLLRNIKSLEFSFWNQETKKYVSSLKELNQDKNTVRGVLLTLTWVDRNEVEQEVSRAYRTMWPRFNAIQDQIDKYTGAAKGNSKGNTGTSGGSNGSN
jgi:prepilin-type N-terminal cleavage/methylation domain-containing protein